MPRNLIYVDECEGIYACDSCQRDFRCSDSLYQHCQRAALHADKWCGGCCELFASRHELLQHDWTVHRGCCTDYNQTCEERSFRKHRQSMHSECAQCGKGCINQNNLRQHLKIHLPKTKACTSCFESFTSTSAVLLHQETDTCRNGMTAETVYRIVWILNPEWDRTKGPNGRLRCKCGKGDLSFGDLVQHFENSACGWRFERNAWAKKACEMLVKDIAQADRKSMVVAQSGFVEVYRT